jgi:hypothetical protein
MTVQRLRGQLGLAREASAGDDQAADVVTVPRNVTATVTTMADVPSAFAAQTDADQHFAAITAPLSQLLKGCARERVRSQSAER